KDRAGHRCVSHSRPHRPQKQRFVPTPTSNQQPNSSVRVATIDKTKMAFYPLQRNTARRQNSREGGFHGFVRGHKKFSHKGNSTSSRRLVASQKSITFSLCKKAGGIGRIGL